MIDVTSEINAVRRTVGTRVLEAGEARTATITRTYDAAIEDLWDACTTPERIARWFLPVSGDLHVGGHYQLQGNAGGTVERCDPPKSFGATWEFDGDVSWIEVRLTPDPSGGTRFELEHIALVGDDRWEEFGPGAIGVGWDTALMGLGLHVVSGAAVDPQEAMAWAMSADGKRFMALSSDAWCAANVAGGADEQAARAAADRTTAAYTGA